MGYSISHRTSHFIFDILSLSFVEGLTKDQQKLISLFLVVVFFQISSVYQLNLGFSSADLFPFFENRKKLRAEKLGEYEADHAPRFLCTLYVLVYVHTR